MTGYATKSFLCGCLAVCTLLLADDSAQGFPLAPVYTPSPLDEQQYDEPGVYPDPVRTRHTRDTELFPDYSYDIDPEPPVQQYPQNTYLYPEPPQHQVPSPQYDETLTDVNIFSNDSPFLPFTSQRTAPQAYQHEIPYNTITPEVPLPPYNQFERRQPYNTLVPPPNQQRHLPQTTSYRAGYRRNTFSPGYTSQTSPVGYPPSRATLPLAPTPGPLSPQPPATPTRSRLDLRVYGRQATSSPYYPPARAPLRNLIHISGTLQGNYDAFTPKLFSSHPSNGGGGAHYPDYVRFDGGSLQRLPGGESADVTFQMRLDHSIGLGAPGAGGGALYRQGDYEDQLIVGYGLVTPS